MSEQHLHSIRPSYVRKEQWEDREYRYLLQQYSLIRLKDSL